VTNPVSSAALINENRHAADGISPAFQKVQHLLNADPVIVIDHSHILVSITFNRSDAFDGMEDRTYPLVTASGHATGDVETDRSLSRIHRRRGCQKQSGHHQPCCAYQKTL